MMKRKLSLLLLCVLLCVQQTDLKAGGGNSKLTMGKPLVPSGCGAEVPSFSGEEDVACQGVSPVSPDINYFDRLPDGIVEKILLHVCIDQEQANGLKGAPNFVSGPMRKGHIPLTQETLAVRSVCRRFHTIIGSAPLARAYYNTFNEPCSEDVLCPSFNVCVDSQTFLNLCGAEPTINQQTDFQIKNAGTKTYPFRVAGKQKIKKLHAISLREQYVDQLTNIDINTEKR